MVLNVVVVVVLVVAAVVAALVLVPTAYNSGEKNQNKRT